MSFDDLIDRAWPALESVRLGDWKVRFADGVTKRANSVLCDGPDGDVAEVERLYRARGLPPVFQVSDPGLDAVLAERGYRIVDPTYVMTGPLTGPLTGPCSPAVNPPVVDAPPPGWLETWWAVDGRYADRLPIAAKIVTGVPAWYCAVDGAVGRGVPQGGLLGIYCMATLPGSRRRGLARRVLQALLDRARQEGLTSAYLCVTAKNEPAQRLYEAAGFAKTAAYHYRVSAS
jgi:GNAT superfamily N-acetyltransferase